MNKEKVIKTILIFSVVLGVIGAFKIIPSFTKGTSEETSQDLGIPIEAIKAKKETIKECISYMGTLEPKETFEVSAKIPTTIKEIRVDKGDAVKKGETIALLDDESIKGKINTININIEKGKLNLEYLSKEEEKYRFLFKEGAISEAAYDKIRHEKEMADLQLKELISTRRELLINLEDTVIKSPIDGVIRVINYAPGDIAMMGKPIVIIDDVSSYKVVVPVSESDLKILGEDTYANLYISGESEIITTNISKISSSLNPKTRIGEVEFDNLGMRSIPIGTSIRVEFILKEIKDALTIPGDSIKELADRRVVYVIEGNNVKEVEIKTGIKNGNSVQVLEGITEDKFIAKGDIYKLFDGAKVYIFKGVTP